jgi:hypothetical protein
MAFLSSKTNVFFPVHLQDRLYVIFTQIGWEGTMVKALPIENNQFIGTPIVFGSHEVAVHSLNWVLDNWILSGDIAGRLQVGVQ